MAKELLGDFRVDHDIDRAPLACARNGTSVRVEHS